MVVIKPWVAINYYTIFISKIEINLNLISYYLVINIAMINSMDFTIL